MAENESGQDEEQVDAEIALGDQSETIEAKIQVVAEMLDQHPQRRADAQRRERTDVRRMHGPSPRLWLGPAMAGPFDD
ncbi:hypothetical protein B7G68_12885 [Caulobacter segnis]|uniref:Acyl-CoA carboxylase subunit epsilon n=1 Tax=Caulobacter segnis TaxID=88688 RepID=A0ABM6THM4_9CAUL|nr:hypothetical protein B7G68_12885 [Caulobacter segnis]